jgi:hypothetical protein
MYKNRQLSFPTDLLCHVIFWTLSTLRDCPIYILIRDLDIASLAVNATAKVSAIPSPKEYDLLLSIDLESYTDILRLIFNILIHARRAESIFNALVLRPFHLRVLLPVLDL